MKVFNWLKKKPIKTTAAVVTALTLSATMTPAVAQSGGGVSGAFLSPSGGYAANGQQSTGSIELKSYQSGDWKLDMNSEDKTSPAWKDFSREARVDMKDVQPGDVDRVFSYLTAGGIDRQACEKSSVIWVAKDTTPSYGGTTINLHRDWMPGIGLNPTGLKSELLRAAPLNGKRTPDLAGIAEAVTSHPAIQNQDFKNLKVLCSFQFDAEPEPEEEGGDPTMTYIECIPSATVQCDDDSSVPPETGGQPTPEICQDTGWATTGADFGTSKYAGIDEFANYVSGESGDGGLGLRLGIAGLTSTWARNLAAMQSGGPEFRNIRVAWRCNTRYHVYYQTAPASYSTKTSLAQITSPTNSKVFNNAFAATQDESTGFLSAPVFGDLVSNSDIAQAWFSGMKIASPTSAIPRESLHTTTNYGRIWNDTRAVDSNGEFAAFYEIARQIDNAVAKDTRSDNNFSSGTGLHLDHLAVLSDGGVLNAEEKERQKIIRVVQPYVELQVAKCVTDDWWSALPPNHCNPLAGVESVPDYSNEKVDLTLTDPTSITIDQANYLINRYNNLIREAGQGNGSAIIEGFTRLTSLMAGDPIQDVQRCVDGISTKMRNQAGSDFNDVWNIGNSGNLATAILRIYRTFDNLRTTVTNVTLPCQDILERGNPEPSNPILGDIINFASEATFFNNPAERFFSIAFVPQDEQVRVQKSQFDPETVSWWQAISVNCNQSGFEQLVAQTGADIVSDDAPGVGSAFHGVARSPIVHVDEERQETLFRPENYFFARPGTASAYSSFYDKECPFNCTSNPSSILGANAENDAENNTPMDLRGSLNGSYGAQVREENNKETYAGHEDIEFVHTDLINIFRDNVERRVRVDVWYPTNNVGSLIGDFNEVRDIIKGGNILDFVDGIHKFSEAAELHASGGSSFGVFYDGSEPTTTVITRFQDGTPTIGDFFRVYAVTDRGEGPGTPTLEAGQGERTEIFKKGTTAEIPNQKKLSQDLVRGGTGSETGAIIPGLVNTIDVASMWASEKSKPQVFNFKWEYQTPSLFYQISSAGFGRNSTIDPNVHPTSQFSSTFTILEGWCYAMFGTNTGKNTIGLFQSNTGTGTKNSMDNGNGLVTTSPSRDDDENLLINSLRSTTE